MTNSELLRDETNAHWDFTVTHSELLRDEKNAHWVFEVRICALEISESGQATHLAFLDAHAAALKAGDLGIRSCS